MTKVIRSHPVVGSRRLQAPYQEGHEPQPKRVVPTLDGEDTVETMDAGWGESVADVASSSIAQHNTLTAQVEVLETKLLSEENRRKSLEAEVETLSDTLSSLQAALDEEKKKGFLQGQRDAQQRVDTAVEEKMAEIASLSTLFSTNLSQQIQDVEKLAVEMTFEALCKIIGERYVEDNLRVSIVENVISSLKDISHLSVYVNPDDIAVISVLGDNIGYQDVRFIGDDRVTKGGCIVESNSGSWDGRLDTQIQRLKETLVSFVKSEDMGV